MTNSPQSLLCPDVEAVLDGLLRGAVAEGTMSQAAAHAVLVAVWHVACLPDDDPGPAGVGRVWQEALRQPA